ncbi:MAG: UDP-N-acetylglucosamine--LPS N-acetylglucosamine transferase [Phycisphaerales bacterium]
MSGREHKRVLCVASGGGHWVQMLRLRPAFEGCDVAFATVREAYRSDVAEDIARGARFYVVNDATRWNKFLLVLQALRVLLILVRERPDVVITTGAAPGFFAVRLGKMLGARVCWIDSIANVEHLSLSGEKAGKFVNLWLTQWPHLAREGGPRFEGAVL